MSEPFLGEIMIVGFTYAPRYWATCSGQIMAANQNQALFTLLGGRFGGDGNTTFGLPNIQARTPVSVGADQNGFVVALAATGGDPSVKLGPEQLPAHTHTLNVTDSPGTTASCSNAFLAQLDNAYTMPAAGGLTTLSPATLSTVGQGASHDNRQPYLGMTFIIALSGVFPSKN